MRGLFRDPSEAVSNKRDVGSIPQKTYLPLLSVRVTRWCALADNPPMFRVAPESQ
jgi:hypothetical protein